MTARNEDLVNVRPNEWRGDLTAKVREHVDSVHKRERRSAVTADLARRFDRESCDSM